MYFPNFLITPLSQISIWENLYLELQINHSLQSKTFPNRNLGKKCATMLPLALTRLMHSKVFNCYISSINLSNSQPVSFGPGDDSGWNCTAKNGFVLCFMPSFVPSLLLMNHSSQSFGRVLVFTAYP